MPSEAFPGDGDVEIELDGKLHTLKPSLDACIKISRLAGGLNAAVQRCLQLDFDTICEVVIAGLSLNPRQAQQIPAAVFQTGAIQLSAPCIDFINICGNGGRPIELDDEGGDDTENPPRPASL